MSTVNPRSCLHYTATANILALKICVSDSVLTIDQNICHFEYKSLRFLVYSVYNITEWFAVAY